MINGGCSDDGFIDFRYGLISQGRDIYEAAVKDPDSLADAPIGLEAIDDEMFGYVASELYEEKASKNMPRKEAAVSEPGGEDWDFDDQVECRRKLPKLAEKFL